MSKPYTTLEGVIEEVAASYRGARPIDSLESAALPNSRKVVEALGHLQHVCYMGFYSTRGLTEENLRHYIGERLHEAAAILQEQIARAVVYRRAGGGKPEAEDLATGEQAVLSAFAALPKVRELLHGDVEAAYHGDPAAKSIEEVIFSYPAIEAITVYRIAHEFHVLGAPLIPRIMSEQAHNITGIDIHPGATIGQRFFIDHGTGVVIGETSVIGDNVKLYQGVTLGAVSIPAEEVEGIRGTKRHPTLEDGVTVYAGATILGGETVIGRGSVIGGNVWLTESVAPGTRISYAA